MSVDALDVLLFDRRSRQARLTAVGRELLQEGRRLLAEMDAVANRVRRVATGWESELTIAVDGAMSRATLLELVESFYGARPQGGESPGTRPRLRTETLAGLWESLVTGQADLAIGVITSAVRPHSGIEVRPLGEVMFVFAVAPHHPLARVEGPLRDADLIAHRAGAVADSAQRLSPAANLPVSTDIGSPEGLYVHCPAW